MPNYEHTATVRASADDVFAFVADVRNMPKYLPTTKAAQPQGEDRVRVQGEARGHRYDSDGYLRRLADRNRLEWGADEGYYNGWLEARDAGDGRTEVRVGISLRGTPPGADAKDRPPDEKIREGLEAALLSIQRHLEGRGGKVEPSVTTSEGADAKLSDGRDAGANI